jgi:hypothetical protein
MAITDSRVKNGTLGLGETPIQFETQATNVAIVPDHTQEDGVETLSGDMSSPSLTTTYSLVITAIQDFDDAAGFVAYTWDESGTEVPFTWEPSGATGPTYAGTCQIRAVEVGGDVATQLTTEAEFPIVGVPTRTEPAAQAASTPSSSTSKGK